MSRPLIFEIDRGIARITLNRPEKLNSISLEMARQFTAAVEELKDRADVAVVVLSGAGETFCAGGDVTEISGAGNRPDFIGELAATMHSGLAALADLPVVTITALKGAVRGGGIGLALAGDLCIAGRSTTFRAAYSAVGLSPDCGITASLTASMGMHQALKFVILNEVMTADTAADLGLLAEVVEDSDVDARVEELAASIVSGPWRALGESRRVIRSAPGHSLPEQLAREEAAIIGRVDDTEARLRLDAFQSKVKVGQ